MVGLSSRTITIYTLMDRCLIWKQDHLKLMSQYDEGNCLPFLYKLLDLYWSDTNEFSRVDLLVAKHPDLLEKLVGPHGLTVMRALVAVYEERQNDNHG